MTAALASRPAIPWAPLLACLLILVACLAGPGDAGRAHAEAPGTQPDVWVKFIGAGR